MKPPDFLGRATFWLAISNLALGCVVVYLFTSQAAINEAQRADLEKICTTTETIDLAVVQPLLFETNAALADIPPGPQRVRILQYLNNLQVAHEALSETTSCETVR